MREPYRTMANLIVTQAKLNHGFCSKHNLDRKLAVASYSKIAPPRTHQGVGFAKKNTQQQPEFPQTFECM